MSLISELEMNRGIVMLILELVYNLASAARYALLVRVAGCDNNMYTVRYNSYW